MIKAAVIGATGYSGATLISILANHKDVEIVSLTSKSYVGKKFSDIYKNFKGIVELELEEQNLLEISKKADVIFVCLPHGIASSEVTQEVLNNSKVIDLGADFRLKDKNCYEAWYKVEHKGEDVLAGAVYGLPEWNKEKIKTAKLIANPGCYATASILTVAPLLKEGLVNSNDIVIDAKSGVSGAGRSLDLSVHFCECNETIKPYKIATHRHTPEIEQVLSDISGANVLLNFQPHLVPMNRGILACAYLKPTKDVSLDELKEVYKKYYKNKAFIRVLEGDEAPETKWTKGSNYCDINVFKDSRTGRILAFGALDNLVKGAAGQAVQNMNIMFNLDETSGLKNNTVFP